MKTLSVVVPVYWNAASVSELAAEFDVVEAELAKRDIALQLIFVDDGSGDDSLAQLLAYKNRRPDTKIIKLARNFGAPLAVKTGFRHATGDAAVMIPADLQEPPSILLTLVEPWLAGSKIVLGVRETRDDPTVSKLLSWAYYVVVRRLISANYPRNGFNIALVDKDLLPHLRESSKSLNPDLIVYWLGFKPAIVPITRSARKHGKSRWTLRKKLNYFLDSILGFSAAPLRAMSLVGFAVAFASLAYALFAIFARLSGLYHVPGFATLVVLVTFLQGVVLVFLGLIGEYVWRIYDELNKRPDVVIEAIY